MMKLDCSALGMVMDILKTSKDTDGKALVMEWTLLPNSGGTPVHVHPTATETYEVLSGELEVYKKDRWITAKAGDKITIEKGEPHTFKNLTNKSVQVLNTHEPAMEFENFFKGLQKFSASGYVKNGKMSFKSVVGISTLWTNYSREIVSIAPPYLLMKILGFCGRLVGINFK